ncbi:hypothetical protein KAU40_00615 [Candidatus Parcubacteria bacterium]|nr:hypothetical protein [Candidatus Parcubacteria bacterium]
MEGKKIAIIGVGGRTGTMFAFELGKANNILGISREKEVEQIKERKLYVQRQGRQPELFEGKVSSDFQFSSAEVPDIIFMATKNPVGPVVKYYYQKIKDTGKFPALVLSQNGIAAIQDAIQALEEVFGLEQSKKIQIIRLNLFNAIDRKELGDKIYVSYSLPIRIAFTSAYGPKDIQDIAFLFKQAGFEAKEFPCSQVKDMEFSKLFLNLIGMASAVKGLSINQGFRDKQTFKQEAEALKEYIKVVHASGSNFVNFPHYPVKLLACLFFFLPMNILLIFRNYLAKLISKGRQGKPKGNLDEIEYYNGAVIDLAEKNNIPATLNQQILKKALELEACESG